MREKVRGMLAFVPQKYYFPYWRWVQDIHKNLSLLKALAKLSYSKGIMNSLYFYQISVRKSTKNYNSNQQAEGADFSVRLEQELPHWNLANYIFKISFSHLVFPSNQWKEIHTCKEQITYLNRREETLLSLHWLVKSNLNWIPIFEMATSPPQQQDLFLLIGQPYITLGLNFSSPSWI